MRSGAGLCRVEIPPSLSFHPPYRRWRSETLFWRQISVTASALVVFKKQSASFVHVLDCSYRVMETAVKYLSWAAKTNNTGGVNISNFTWKLNYRAMVAAITLASALMFSVEVHVSI